MISLIIAGLLAVGFALLLLKPKQRTLNLKKNPQGVIDALIQMDNHNSKKYGKNVTEVTVKFELLSKDDPNFGATVGAAMYHLNQKRSGIFIIYGWDGMSRYNVHENGDVIFSAYHCANKAEQARKLGFKVIK
jgi:hypothetical protein